MIVACPKCKQEHSVDESRLPPEGAMESCSACGHRFRIDPVHDATFNSYHRSSARQDNSGDLATDPQIPRFSIGEAVRFGWDTTKKNLGFFVGFFVLAGLLLLALSMAVELASRNAPAVTTFIFQIVSIVIQSAVSMGFIRTALKFCDNEKGDFSDFFSCLPLFFKYFFGSVLYMLIVIGGMILLIIPGIIWSIKFVFFSYFIVDKGQGPIEALRNSSKITEGAKWDLLLLGLLLAGINILGFLALIVGLFVTMPLSMLAFAFAFRRLEARAGSTQEKSDSPSLWN